MATTIASSSSSNQPNPTLYIGNLNTKTKKPELRRQLYCLFSTYGKVIDVVATRAENMRGQAFVVFRELSSATAARRALEGFEFYEKSLRIDYAKTRSKASIIQEHGPEALFNPTLLASSATTSSNLGETSAAGASSSKVTVSSAQAEQKGREKKRAREEARQRGENVAEDEESEEEEDDAERETKIRKVEATEEEGGKATNGVDATEAAAQPEQEEEEEDEDAMDMGESDSDDDDDTPGPPPPP